MTLRILIMVVVGLTAGVLLTLAARGQAMPYPNPKGHGCASGYVSSGGYCNPMNDRSAPAIPRAGNAACPSGWTSSGGYSCVKMRR